VPGVARVGGHLDGLALAMQTLVRIVVQPHVDTLGAQAIGQFLASRITSAGWAAVVFNINPTVTDVDNGAGFDGHDVAFRPVFSSARTSWSG
jgi:hypothetical protein